MLGISWDAWFYGAAVVFSVLSAVFSQRAASWAKAANMGSKFLNKIIGKPDPALARPTTGTTVVQKVESAGEDLHGIAYNQLLIAQTLRILSDDLASLKGNGKRRLPTDTISIPQEILDEQRLRNSNPDAGEARMD